MRPSARPFAALALAAAVGLGAGEAAASPEDVFGYGARSSAMGATGAADSAGHEAVYGNPALLSLSRSRELTLGFAGASFDLHAHKKVSYEGFKGSLIGAVLPIPFGGALKDRVALGVGFMTPFDLVVRGRILYPEKPQFPIADRAQSVAVQAGMGVDLGHGIRIGGGFAALAALKGSVLVATDASGRIGTVVDDTLVASYGPIAGLSWDVPGGAYRIGATFRGALVGRFNVVITVKDLGDLTVPPLNISGTAQYDPWQLAFEVARVKGPWRIALGATYKHWSSYPGLAEPTVRCPLYEPTTGVPPAPECNVLTVKPPNYHDTVVPRVGVERLLDLRPGVTLALRGGAFLEPTPSPLQNSSRNLYDNTRLAVTLGYGVALGPPFPRLDFDVFGQAQGLLPRVATKADPADAPAAGARTVTTSGVIAAGGATVGVKF